MTTLSTGLDETIMDHGFPPPSHESSALSPGHTATALAMNTVTSEFLERKCVIVEWKCGEGVKFSRSPVGD